MPLTCKSIVIHRPPSQCITFIDSRYQSFPTNNHGFSFRFCGIQTKLVWLAPSTRCYRSPTGGRFLCDLASVHDLHAHAHSPTTSVPHTALMVAALLHRAGPGFHKRGNWLSAFQHLAPVNLGLAPSYLKQCWLVDPFRLRRWEPIGSVLSRRGYAHSIPYSSPPAYFLFHPITFYNFILSEYKSEVHQIF